SCTSSALAGVSLRARAFCASICSMILRSFGRASRADSASFTPSRIVAASSSERICSLIKSSCPTELQPPSAAKHTTPIHDGRIFPSLGMRRCCPLSPFAPRQDVLSRSESRRSLLGWIQQLAQFLEGVFPPGNGANAGDLAEQLLLTFEQLGAVFLFEALFFF